MPPKARRKKKTPVRAVKPVPITRKRRVGRSAKAADPVLALGEHRERLEAWFEEARTVQEVTLQGIRQLVETTGAQARGVSEQIVVEMEKLEAHCRKLKERHAKLVSEPHPTGCEEV
jgi:hypothetical protein